MKPYPMELREGVIRVVNLGELTQEEVAEEFGISVRCLQDLLRLYEETGSVAPRKIGRPVGTGTIPEDRVAKFVKEHPDATLGEIKAGCHCPESLAAIWKVLQRLGLSRKKKVSHAAEQETSEVQHKRQKWMKKSRRLPAQRLIFIDQTGINTRMDRTYGRAPVGQRVIGKIPERHYQASTLMGALHFGGEFESLVYPGGTDVTAVLTFIETQLVPVLRPGDIVIWDNLSPHHSPAVIRAIEATGARVEYLPPYSPDFNPIEKLWSKVKGCLRGIAARTQEALIDGLDKALQQVTTLDVQHWFKHCGYTQAFC
jgi:transposase